MKRRENTSRLPILEIVIRLLSNKAGLKLMLANCISMLMEVPLITIPLSLPSMMRLLSGLLEPMCSKTWLLLYPFKPKLILLESAKNI